MLAVLTAIAAIMGLLGHHVSRALCLAVHEPHAHVADFQVVQFVSRHDATPFPASNSRLVSMMSSATHAYKNREATFPCPKRASPIDIVKPPDGARHDCCPLPWAKAFGAGWFPRSLSATLSTAKGLLK